MNESDPRSDVHYLGSSENHYHILSYHILSYLIPFHDHKSRHVAFFHARVKWNS